MGKKRVINRKKSKQMVPYRVEMLIYVFLWFLIGCAFAQIFQTVFDFTGTAIIVSRSGCGSFFALLFGYVGWVLQKISSA